MITKWCNNYWWYLSKRWSGWQSNLEPGLCSWSTYWQVHLIMANLPVYMHRRQIACWSVWCQFLMLCLHLSNVDKTMLSNLLSALVTRAATWGLLRPGFCGPSCSNNQSHTYTPHTKLHSLWRSWFSIPLADLCRTILHRNGWSQAAEREELGVEG